MVRIFLTEGDKISIGSKAEIFGSTGKEIVIIENMESGIVIDQNVDIINIPISIDEVKFQQQGNKLKIFDLNGNLITESYIQGDIDGTELILEDGTKTSIVIDNNDNVMKIKFQMKMVIKRLFSHLRTRTIINR